MKAGFEQLCTPQMRVLSDSQIKEIFNAACEILETTGMKVDCKETQELLHAHGATVNGDIIRIPSSLVQRAISTMPKRITLSNREGERKIFLEGNKSYFGCNPDNPEYYDPYTGERRPMTSKDGADMARVIDYLPNIDFVLNACFSADVHEDVADRVIIREMMFNMRKTIGFSCKDVDTLQDIIDMGAIIAGSHEELQANPWMFHIQEPISPLVHEENTMKEIKLCAENRFPLVYYPMPMAGATAPATAAGLLAQNLAECFIGLVYHQLVNPGAPIIHGGVASIMDMKTTRFCYGAPETYLQIAALTDILHYYEIPVWGTAGPLDAKTLDQQAATEMTMGYLMAALSGQNLVHDTGLMDQATVTCPEILILANEQISMVRKIMEGVEVNEETLALDVINQSMTSGSFLAEEHTLKHFRKFWQPTLFDRSTAKVAEKTITQKLNEKAIDIIENHEVPELDKDKKKAILELEKKWLKEAVKA